MQFMSKAYNDDDWYVEESKLKIPENGPVLKNENLVELYKQITDPKFYMKTQKILFWRTQYQLGCENAESWRKVFFFAVGAGHLLGEKKD
jgi:uncharacterized protein YbaP (TraB family)